MITHIVTFTWKPGITPEDIDALHGRLAALPGRIEVIRSYVHGPNVGPAESNSDYAVVATFDDLDAYAVYDQHPDHEAVRAELVRPWVATRSAVQLVS